MKKAFTMIELIVVVAILGILTAIAIPKLSGSKTQANITIAKEDISKIKVALSEYKRNKALGSLYEESGEYPDSDGFFNLFNSLNLGSPWNKRKGGDKNQYDIEVKGLGKATFLYLANQSVYDANNSVPGVKNAKLGAFVCMNIGGQADICNKLNN